MNRVLWYLRKAVAGRQGDGTSDGQLLEQYLCQEDEAAFEVLVRRHGPMVLGVCRRILPNLQDAEDAFQATFLVLVRRAAAVWPRDRVGHWLYGVAYRTALKARARASRRQARERPLADVPGPAASDTDVRELRALLDRELSRLPEKYRMPLLLCDLEGRTLKEVAQALNWPEGTVATRLYQARKRLARQLSRLGLAVSAGTVATALAQASQAGPVPPTLIAVTAAGARLFAVQPAAAGPIAVNILSLAQEVLRTMMLTRMKIVGVLLLACVLLGTGSGLAVHAALAEPQTRQADPTAPAAEPQAAPVRAQPKGPVPNKGLEKRLAALEDQIVKLLKEVQSLRQELRPGPPKASPTETRIFMLKNATAAEMAKVLQEIFREPQLVWGPPVLRIGVDERTNSLIVAAPRQQLEEIEALVSKLDDVSTKKTGAAR